MKEYYFGTGRRKTSIAQVRIFKGSGKITNQSNSKVLSDEKSISKVLEPLTLVSKEKDYDITYIVNGGGTNSQLEAIRLGVARALSKTGEEFEKSLKKASLLSRDSREKERKKPGLRRARRAPQWAKR